MAITVIQTASGESVSHVRLAATLSVSLAPTLAGSLIVVAFVNVNDFGVTGGSGVLGTITDDQGDIYVSAIEIDGEGDSDGAVEILYVANAGAGITTITVTPGKNGPQPTFIGSDASLTVWEVGGMSTTPKDQTSSNDDSSVTAGISPGSITLGQATEFVVTAASTGQNGNLITNADSPFDTNFTSATGGDSWDGYSFVISSTTGPFTPNFDLDGSGSGAVSAIASFLSGTGGGAASTQVGVFCVGL